MTFEDLERIGAIPILQAAVGIGLPLTIYLVNRHCLGGRIQFRVLAMFCVSVTALVIAAGTVEFILPHKEALLEARGEGEKSDSYILGALLGGLLLGLFGTGVITILHLKLKSDVRTKEAAGNHSNTVKN